MPSGRRSRASDQCRRSLRERDHQVGWADVVRVEVGAPKVEEVPLLKLQLQVSLIEPW